MVEEEIRQFEAQNTGKTEREVVLPAAATAVTPASDIAAMLPKLAETLGKAIDATSVYIMDWCAETEQSTVLAEYISPFAAAAERVSDLGVTYNMDDMYAAHGSPAAGFTPFTIHANPLDDDVPSLYVWQQQHLQAYGAQSSLHIPLVARGDIIGYVELWESRRRREFTEAEIELCQGIAWQAALAIDNLQRYQVESRRRQVVERLQEISRILVTALDLDELLQRIVDSVRLYLTGVQSCSVSILEQEDQYLRVKASWAERPAYTLYAVGSGISVEKTAASRLVLKTREPLAIVNLQEVPFTNERIRKLQKLGLKSILYIPLTARDQAMGVLHINVWGQPRHFTQEEIDFCQSVANQAAIAIENANLFAAQRRQLRLLQVLQQVGSLLTTSLTLDEVFENIFDLLAQVIKYDAVSIMLLDEQTETVVLAASRGLRQMSLVQSFISDHKEHILTKIPAQPGWRVTPDTAADPDWVYVPEAVNAASWIGALLQVKDRCIGILNVDSLEAGLYDEEMGQTVAVFANQAAVAIENTRLYEETRRQAEELFILYQLGQETAVTLDVDTLLQKTTELITAKFYPNLFAFILFDENLTNFHVHPSARGVPDSLVGRSFPLRHDSMIGRVAETGQPYWSNDVRQTDYYMEVDPMTRSEVVVPLLMRGKIIGALDVESPKIGAFSQRDVDFLVTLAANVAAVIERAGLYEELRQQAGQLARQVAERTAELQIERDRTLAILENAGEGIVLLDAQAILLYANPAFLRQTGYGESELLQQPAFMLVSPETPRKVMRQMIKTVWSGRQWSGELKNQRKDGSQYDVSVTVTPILNDEEDIVGYVAVQSDISRLKELERLKAQFISNISHDLRTPLTNIKTYISLLERGKPEKKPRYFQVLHQETDRLARLIEHLLDMSRLDAEFRLDPQATASVEQIWRRLQERYAEAARQKGVALYWDEPADSFLLMPRLRMAEQHAQKILQHLLDNALTYTQPGDTVVVSMGAAVRDGKEMVWFRVKDDGPGIVAADKPFIFDRFYRGVLAQERNLSGTGLGLAIVQRIVDRYNGRIEWDSQPEQGTWFTVWLPAVWEAE